MDWDDLRILLALSRHQTFVKTARALNVTHSTVSRRIKGLEDAVAARLIDRIPEGVRLTDAGQALVKAATTMEQEVLTTEGKIKGRDGQLSGTLRVALLDVIAVRLADVMVDFTRAHPDVDLELVASNEPVDLGRREADVAIRVTDRPPEHLWGHRLVHFEYAVYIAPGLAPAKAEWATLPWVGWTEEARARLTERWMAENVPEARVAIRVDSVEAMIAMVRAGAGAALLPTSLADSVDLERRSSILPGLGIDLWALAPVDLREAARVRAFMSYVRNAVVTSFGS